VTKNPGPFRSTAAEVGWRIPYSGSVAVFPDVPVAMTVSFGPKMSRPSGAKWSRPNHASNGRDDMAKPVR
jgi:hypothetical protein